MVAAFRPAALRLRVVAAFLAAARRFLVAAAFLPALTIIPSQYEICFVLWPNDLRITLRGVQVLLRY